MMSVVSFLGGGEEAQGYQKDNAHVVTNNIIVLPLLQNTRCSADYTYVQD
jgi:hypothetical protein